MICRVYNSPQHDLVYKPCTIPSCYRAGPVNLVDNKYLLSWTRMHQMCRDFASVIKVWVLIKTEITLGDEWPDLTKPALQKRAQASPEIRESPASLKEASSQELYCYKEMDCVTWAHRARALRRESNQTLTRFLTHRNCKTSICRILGQQAWGN